MLPFNLRCIFGKKKKESRNGKTFKCKICISQINADLNTSRCIAAFSRTDRSRLPANQTMTAERSPAAGGAL